MCDSGTWTEYGLDSDSGCEGGKGGRNHPCCGPGLGKLPQPGRPFPASPVLPHLAIGPTPAAKLALGVGRHPDPAGPPTLSARAALFDPASCSHSFSLGGVRASVPREGPETVAKTPPPPPPGNSMPDRGPWRGWGRGGTEGWRGGQSVEAGWKTRPTSYSHLAVQARQGYGL